MGGEGGKNMIRGIAPWLYIHAALKKMSQNFFKLVESVSRNSTCLDRTPFSDPIAVTNVVYIEC